MTPLFLNFLPTEVTRALPRVFCAVYIAVYTRQSQSPNSLLIPLGPPAEALSKLSHAFHTEGIVPEPRRGRGIAPATTLWAVEAGQAQVIYASRQGLPNTFPRCCV